MQAICQSRGGRTSKLHALTNEQGGPRVLLLTAGNIKDISVARALLQAAGQVRRLIADRGYEANHLRRFLAERQAEAVIPSTTSRRMPIPHDALAYKSQNRIERMRCRLNDWRRIATRSGKVARNYHSGTYLAAAFACWAD
jgi:transposase